MSLQLCPAGTQLALSICRRWEAGEIRSDVENKQARPVTARLVVGLVTTSESLVLNFLTSSVASELEIPRYLVRINNDAVLEARYGTKIRHQVDLTALKTVRQRHIQIELRQ